MSPGAQRIPTYIGACCREWVLAAGGSGRCGLCQEVPTYLRPDDGARQAFIEDGGDPEEIEAIEAWLGL